MQSLVSDADICRKYITLCANPLRPNSQVISEYEQLKAHPRVNTVGFLDDVLMVGTDNISIIYQGVQYLIGEFVIFILRRQVANYWEVNFRFWNVTHPVWLSSSHGKADICVPHPHILPAQDSVLDCPNGILCMTRGQFSIYQYIRKGEIHKAVPLLIEILEIYPTDQPYLDVTNWPVWE